MNESNMPYTSIQDNLDIDVADMFKYVFKKWPIILVASIVFGLIFGFVFAPKTSTPTNVSENQESTLSAEDLQEVEYVIEMEENLKAYIETYKEKYISENAGGELGEADYYYIASINQMVALVNNAKSMFSSEQKAYYNSLLSGESLKADGVESTDAGMERFSKKNMFIGAVAGLIAACFLAAIPYITSDRLRTADDLSAPFGIFSLGIIEKMNRIFLESQTILFLLPRN